MPTDSAAAQAYAIRPPTEADAVAIWRLVQSSHTLDHNSFYCYFVQCRHFPATCAVAEANGRIVGFVTGHRPATQPDTLFIWQIRVLEEMRGSGLGLALLSDVVERGRLAGVRYVEATIAPANDASRGLFHSLARRSGAPCLDEPFLEPEMFPPDAGVHDPEHLFRIGPLPA